MSYIQLVEVGVLIFILITGSFILAPFIMVVSLVIGLVWRYIVKSIGSLTYLCLYHVITSMYILNYILTFSSLSDIAFVIVGLFILYKVLSIFFIFIIKTNETLQKERNKAFLPSLNGSNSTDSTQTKKRLYLSGFQNSY